MGRSFGKFLLVFLVALLVFGIAAVAISFALRDTGYDFSVEVSGNRYYADTDNDLTLLAGQTYDFAVQSSLEGEVDFNVRVLANSENNFSFSANDTQYLFYGADDQLNDYSSVFRLSVTPSGFSLTLPQNTSMGYILSQKFDCDVEIFDDISDSISYFSIVVESLDKVITFDIYFDWYIAIDPPHIAF